MSLPREQRHQLAPRNHRRDPREGAASLQSQDEEAISSLSL